ncbi:MAG: hypothetical protein LBG06_07045 [Deltaproteobacteria bacterium]|nr:hypothetical protein [Deltaproteobacteria bacterium]
MGAHQVSWEKDLSEVMSLDVREGFRGIGMGRSLTRASEEGARALPISMLFAFTHGPGFFFRQGYRQVGLDPLPQKIRAVRFNCVHYPDRKGIAVVKELDQLRTARGTEPAIGAAALKEGAVVPGPPSGGPDAPAVLPLGDPGAPAGLWPAPWDRGPPVRELRGRAGTADGGPGSPFRGSARPEGAGNLRRL